MKKKSWKINSSQGDSNKLSESQSCIFHLNQVLLAVRKINQLIVQERDEKRLLEKACKILVETRGYRLAWVCAIKETEKIVYPAASFGPGKNYLKELKFFWGDSRIAEGLIGTAIKFGRAITCEDIPTDKNCKQWKAKAKKFGFAASAIAPIVFGKKVFGTINVHSDKKHFFDKEELLLLNEIARDMGLALKSIGDESEHKIIEERMLIINKAVESSSDSIGISDAHGRHVYQNKAATKMFGYESAEEMQAAGGGAAIVKDPRVAKEMYKRIIKGEPWSGELEVLTKSGRVFPAFERADAIKDSQGKVIGLIGIVTDITKQNQIEQKLRASNEKLKNLSNLLPQTVFEINEEGMIAFLNHRGFQIFGYDKKDFARGIKGLQLIASADRARAVSKILTGKNRNKIESGEYLAVKKDGNIFPAMVYTSKEIGENGLPVIRGFLVDISDIKQFENKLKETAAKDEALLRGIADGVIAIDAESRIIFINKEAKRLLGYSEDEAVGKRWYKIFRKKNELGEYIPYTNSEFEVVLKSGSIIGSVTPNFYEGKNGKVFPVSASVSPVIIGKKIVGAINVFRDISREIELENSKTDFLSLASHQLRTPLAAIKWTLDLFIQGGGFSAKQKSYLNDLRVSNEHLIGLVNSLLNVVRIQTGKLVINKKLVIISDLIDQVRRICRVNAEKKNQTINVSIKTKIEPTKIDSTLFREALSNIVSNASIYGLKNSKIDISVRSNKEFYIVAVHNFGSAISKYEQDRIFTKFYRGQKQTSTGTIGSGLGLFLAKSAVENNGGAIWLKSRAGRGTTFFFSVPKYPA